MAGVGIEAYENYLNSIATFCGKTELILYFLNDQNYCGFRFAKQLCDFIEEFLDRFPLSGDSPPVEGKWFLA